MKKTLIAFSFVFALLLVGYGCKGKGSHGGAAFPENEQIDDKGIAFEVFQRIPKEDLDVQFQKKTYTCPEDCRRHFGDSEGNDSDAEFYLEGGNFSFSVDCFPFNDGGWLAMLINEGCFDGCKQTVRTYRYKDGVLNYAVDVLPRPTMEEMIVDPFLVYGIEEWEMNDLRAEWNNRYLYNLIGDDTLTVSIECLGFDDMFNVALHDKQYVWDGGDFVEIVPAEDPVFNIIDFDGLGHLKLGGDPPLSVVGYDRIDDASYIVYSRNGQQVFKTEIDDYGMVEAIDVYTKTYSHNGNKVGDTLFKKASEEGYKTYYKDGTFVVTDDRHSGNCRLDYVGPTDAMSGSFVEGPIAEPKFKRDATVQFVRIYKFRDWQNDTCDMRALRESLGDALLIDGFPEYQKNDFRYFREMYNDSCQGWCDALHYYLHCYPLKGGGFKVYETTDFQPGWEDETPAGFTLFSSYIYKDGVLIDVKPESELNAFPLGSDNYHFASVKGVYFYDRTMTIATELLEDGRVKGVEFTWDGTAMKKTFEGILEN